jgi:hypothetical protein
MQTAMKKETEVKTAPPKMEIAQVDKQGAQTFYYFGGSKTIVQAVTDLPSDSEPSSRGDFRGSAPDNRLISIGYNLKDRELWVWPGHSSGGFYRFDDFKESGIITALFEFAISSKFELHTSSRQLNNIIEDAIASWNSKVKCVYHQLVKGTEVE